MEKKIYTAPAIEIIFLDNQISLALESSPPEGPNEFGNIIQTVTNNPYKQEV